MIWFAPKGLIHISDSALCSPHRLSPKFRPLLFYSCCPWWSSHERAKQEWWPYLLSETNLFLRPNPFQETSSSMNIRPPGLNSLKLGPPSFSDPFFVVLSELEFSFWPRTHSVNQVDLKITELHLLLFPECTCMCAYIHTNTQGYTTSFEECPLLCQNLNPVPVGCQASTLPLSCICNLYLSISTRLPCYF